MEKQKRHNRRSIRLKEYDYSREGAYFVTICSRSRKCKFGKISDGTMQLNKWGKLVENAQQYSYVTLDASVIMPNHLHGIIVIDSHCRGGSRAAPTLKHKSLGSLIGAFKTVSTKRINRMQGKSGIPLWQRNYYEHVIRYDDKLNRIRQYIIENPLKWELDPENPTAQMIDETEPWNY